MLRQVMAIPNYAYLKLKISGLRWIIFVNGNACQAHLCKWENCNITMAVF